MRPRANPRRLRALLALCALLAAGVASLRVPAVRGVARAVLRRARGRHSVDDRLAQYGPAARARWAPWFGRAGVAYPPREVTLVGLKDVRELRVYARDAAGAWRSVRRMPVLALSGGPGPKLREGDRQVPEGLYAIDSLNPDSLYHLALRVAYPSDDDRARARADGRTRLGGDIMIHGSNGSVGCLAMGDEAAEDLFVLAADAGIGRVRVLLAPTDLRFRPAWPPPPGSPPWVAERYAQLRAALGALP